jgi:hypothetical protein
MKVREAYGGANDSKVRAFSTLCISVMLKQLRAETLFWQAQQAPSPMVWVVLANNEDSPLAAVDSNDATVAVDSFLVVGGMVLQPNRP